MSNNPVRRNIDVISPLFDIPDGVDEFVYDETSSGELTLSEDSFSGSEGDEYDFSGDVFVTDDDINYSNAPPTPAINGVIEEIVHTGPTGNQVIDVIIDVQDIEGAINYEFRVTAL